MAKFNPNTNYAVYRGDEFLDIGTRDYILKEFNITLSSFHFYCSKHNLIKYDNRKLKHKPSGRLIIIRLEEDDEKS